MRKISVFLALAAALYGQERHVVVISLDGYPAYALRDPQTPAPNLRRLIREGTWAPEGMTNINPTVTWPNHTSMVTGVDASRHGVLYNGLPVRSADAVKIEPWVPKAQLVLAPTVYDLAHTHGMKTAEVDWVAIFEPQTIDYAFSEVPKLDASIVKEMIAAGAVSAADIENFGKAPITYRDELWTQAAAFILEKHRPNLLLYHELTTDSSQHKYGARSLGAVAALGLVDAHVGQLVEAARAAGILDSTTFLVVSDHGFHTATKIIRPAALLKEKGIKDVVVVPEGGTAMLYGTVPPGTFSSLASVCKVITPDQFAALGFPPPGGRMADLVLAAADGYAFAGGATGPVVVDVPPGTNPGNHGYLSSNPDMRPIFVAWGAGIKAGAKVEGVRTIDVAPTIARLLGLDMKNIDGQVITGALR
jgi:predicted AlkP superfamily pyrophosphatase or phosphodiesterase